MHHLSLDMPNAGPPVSAFQKGIRGRATVLRDHICKEMNALNLERCRCIPKNVPGADWRVLQQIVAQDPSREKYEVCFSRDIGSWPKPAFVALMSILRQQRTCVSADSHQTLRSVCYQMVCVWQPPAAIHCWRPGT